LPEYRKSYEALVEYYEEAAAPHLVFGNFSRFVECLLERKDSNGQLLKRAFAFCETLATSDDIKVQEVLQMSFLENLGKNRTILELAQEYMGPITLNLLREIEEFWEGGRG